MSDETPVSASDYGKSLHGLGFNVIVRDVSRAIVFAEQVLGATVYFRTAVFAAMKLCGRDFMFHADDTYRANPLRGSLESTEPRGIGVELHCYGVDPDQAEARARQGGWTVLAGSMDKPHGLREAMILDDDGFVWIPSVHLKD